MIVFNFGKIIMDQLIATCLFVQKKCYLPGIGQLSLIQQPAESNFVEMEIQSPRFSISYNANGDGKNELVPFIADLKRISMDEAFVQLENYCNQIKGRLHENKSYHLNGVGNFIAVANDTIRFEEQELPPYYFPSIHAKRVIHPQSEHIIVVGDKESTNVAMADLLAEVPVNKDKWWIWAIVLAVLAALAMLFHYGNTGNSSLGNGNSIY